MSQWYYVDSNNQRQGPVSRETLLELARGGALPAPALVWREGLSEWTPLDRLQAELQPDAAGPEASLPAAAASGRIEPTFGAGPDAGDDDRPPAGSFAPAQAGADAPYAPPSASLTRPYSPGIHGPVVHAGFWKRFAASFIDGLLMGVVFLVFMVAAGAVLGLGMGTMAQDLATGAVAPLLILLIYLVPIGAQAIYFTWMHASSHQATLGKLAVGIKVVHGQGGTLSVGRSLGRWAAYFFLHLFTCGLASLVSAFLVGLGERRQGLHDMVADTLVVDRWAFTEHPERQRTELGGVTIAVIVLAVLLMLGYFAVFIGMTMLGAMTR